MTASKTIHEYRTILDFSNKVSKNIIKQSLQNAEVLSICPDKNSVTYIENEIKVGMYTVHLHLHNYETNIRNLRGHGRFSISIHQTGNTQANYLESKFKDQPWVKRNDKADLRIQDLINIIYYCNRLNQLKIFL